MSTSTLAPQRPAPVLPEHPPARAPRTTPARGPRSASLIAGAAVCGLAAVAVGAAVATVGGADSTQAVPGIADIEAAGLDGSASSGLPPVLWELPPGTDRVATFPEVTGGTDSLGLVGVLLSDAPGPAVAPERIGVGDATGAIAPEIGQTFPVGDGEDLEVAVPDGATRLYLGFPDGGRALGAPPWLGDPAFATVTVEVDTP